KFNKLNPISGIKRIFSLRSIVELIKSILKVTLIIVIIYSTVIDIMTIAPDMLNTALDENIRFLRQNVMSMVYTVTMIFAVIAAADFFYQRYDYEKKLKMTKQEVKDEYKQIEGDPQIKGKIRQKQRQMSQARMMSQVPQADVIVRNPTHFAVAIRYDAQKDPAPLVLAKGQDYLALKIIELGEANDVLIKEDKPLAQMLYKTIEVNDYIPPEMYQIVAELMAWVYNTKKKEFDIS
ncbi:MAG: flagellar biosynthesis protein FlhB, partial [Eubacteriaceae bacterium]